MTSIPSNPLEKYSALLWPKACLSSAGFAATVSMPNAMTAPARLTRDSTASESRPTEPVILHAVIFIPIVRRAARMDKAANRLTGHSLPSREAAGSGTGSALR